MDELERSRAQVAELERREAELVREEASLPTVARLTGPRARVIRALRAVRWRLEEERRLLRWMEAADEELSSWERHDAALERRAAFRVVR